MRYLTISIFILGLTPFHLNATKKQTVGFQDLPDDVMSLIFKHEFPKHNLKAAKSIYKRKKFNKQWNRATNYFIQERPYLKLIADLKLSINGHCEYWSSEALKSAKQNTNPTHLFEIEKVEDVMFEEALENISQLKKFETRHALKIHIISIILTFHTLRLKVQKDAKEASINAIKSQINQQTSAMKILESRDMYDRKMTQAIKFFDHANEGEMNKNIYSKAVAILDQVRNDIVSDLYEQNEEEEEEEEDDDTLEYDDFESLFHEVYQEVDQEVISNKLQQKALQAILKYVDLNALTARNMMIYRVAEIQAWIAMLNPDAKYFETVYFKIFDLLEKVFLGDMLPEWFESKECFIEKINTYFLIDQDSTDELPVPLLSLFHERLQSISF